MASQDVKYEVPEPATEVVDAMPLNEITALGHRQQQLAVTPVSEDLNFPSVETILSTLEGEIGPSAAVREHLDLSVEEQSQMYRALQNVLSKSEENEGSFDVEELRASLEHADAAARQGQRSLQALQGVIATLEKLWYSRSRYMAEAAEALANGSREPSWRLPFGRSGILKFFLQVIAAREEVDEVILFHSLRLIGNSCADTDENRQIAVTDNYTLPIIRLILRPGLVHVAIPVIYNICTDFAPAQSQVATNRIAYILLKLISDGAIEGNALLNYAYELVEMASEQGDGIESSPDGTVLLIMNLALDEDTTFAQFACLVNCLVTYLRNERFQNACIRHRLLEQLLSVLRHSYAINVDESASEDVQLLSQLQSKLNEVLSDISALPQFAETYPLDSPLINSLKTWLEAPEEQLQICACVMLGNLARSDEVCQVMIERLNIHKSLIAMLKRDVPGSILHASLGFLKNLAIAGGNRTKLGDAGIIPIASHIWTLDSVPQVQLAAVSLIRLVIAASFENISRLLDPLSPDPDSPAHLRTYLSLLLSLFGKTDAVPIKTEIGRLIASICRTLIPRAREEDHDAESLLEHLFSLHEDVYRPVEAMVIQTEWPVMRSEGWFALALMASDAQGSSAVADCIQSIDVYKLLEDSLSGEASSPASEGESLQRSKDKDNMIILIKEVLGHDAESLSETRKLALRDLMNNAAAKSL